MLVFLLPDETRLNELEDAIRQYLAWKSINEERLPLNLDQFQIGQAESKLKSADETVDSRIVETYVWLMAPYQTDPTDQATYGIEEYRLQGNDALPVLCSRRLVATEGLFIVYGATRLRMDLDKLRLFDQAQHVALKQLWEYFTRYVYMPRLRDERVLMAAIQEGVRQTTWQELFAYAAAQDPVKERYSGLMAGEAGSVLIDSHSLLLRPDVALQQIEAERTSADPGPTVAHRTDGNGGHSDMGGGSVIQPEPQVKVGKRFFAAVTLSPMVMGSDAAKIADAIVQHLASLPNASVRLTLEIQADLPEGVTEQIRRIVLENAHTLKFNHAEFEDS